MPTNLPYHTELLISWHQQVVVELSHFRSETRPRKPSSQSTASEITRYPLKNKNKRNQMIVTTVFTCEIFTTVLQWMVHKLYKK